MNTENYKVVIIGAGFVGGTLYKAISGLTGYEVKIYDKNKETCRLASEVENVNWATPSSDLNADIYFLCLPTPMVADSGGECDYSLVAHWIKNLTKKSRTLSEIVIKSTVPPGTTAGLNKKYGGGIYFSPEFLTEKNAYEDFINLPYQIIGSNKKNKAHKTKKLFEDAYAQGRMKCAEIFEVDSSIAEMIKYTRNCYLATRLSFFNEINQLCESLKIPYGEMKKLAGLDVRLGNHYNEIDPEEPEFSGHCLPKDLNALICKMNKRGVKPTVLSAVWEKNLEVAKKKSWEKMEGRAISHSATAPFKEFEKRKDKDAAKRKQKALERAIIS